MKLALAAIFFGLLTPSVATASAMQDKTITQVVKLLQDMLDTSKQEGDEERTAYAKYVCDSEKRITEYKDTIATSTESISLLANQIAGLKASNGKLSKESAELQAEMAANEKAQQEQTDLRNKDNAAFEAEKTDLEAAIGQLEEALATLAEVSADQTAADATAKDHTKFMSGYTTKYNPVGLLKAKSSLRKVLDAASAFMDQQKARKVEAFVQAPFTGSYTSQAVEVMGVLKNMKDTFDMNLQQAKDTEAAQLKAYNDYMALKQAEYSDMSTSYDKKQAQLAANDVSLQVKKGQKKDTEDTMAEAESFLATAEELLAAKKAEYSKRRLLQTQEEAAISEAISILDSDAAFATFGTVSATSTGSLGFLQLKSIQKHTTENDHLRSELMQTLSKVKGSKRLSKLKSLVKATNVFEVVLTEIDKILALITEEGKADASNLEFCNTERTTNDALIESKRMAIEDELKPKILQLTNDIEDPNVGLKKQISDTEVSLLENRDDQKKSTEERTAANLLYQEDRKNLAEAKAILNKAIDVLDAYYKKLDKALQLGLVQKKNTPVPTEDTAVLKMEGVSTSGKDVISKLLYILGETKTEESDAISAENAAQLSFEGKMAGLKAGEAALEQSLAGLKLSLASTEKELFETKEDLKTTEDEKAKAEAYLAGIKPGCDFITTNFRLRETNRAEESRQLNAAIDLIKGTPVYLDYTAKTHIESLKGCVSICEPGEEKAECKACLADVTVPAYCAGHPGTPGC